MIDGTAALLIYERALQTCAGWPGQAAVLD